MPRFIINVRELYDRDPHGRWQGIDSGFRFAAVTRGQGLITEGPGNELEMIRIEVLVHTNTGQI
jgi:hypothetical protein